MQNNDLSAIERELVLQYLMDGNIPVTLTPVKEDTSSSDEVQSVPSAIFPVALKAENIKVSESGKILLEKPSQSIQAFTSKKVKVEFYFNRVGLFFYSEVKEDNNGLSINIPEKISRIQEVVEDIKYDFNALLYFDFNSKKDVQTSCIPWKFENLFSRPVWKSIPLENQKTAKEYLEVFVNQAKIEKNAGNGIQLIPICNYLTMNEVAEIKAVEGRKEPLYVLYVDHERIVLGFEQKNYSFLKNQEFGVRLSFSLKAGPILSRDIFVTGRVNNVYESSDKIKGCVDIAYTTLQEEDLRFLYEKTTKKLFI